MHFTCCMPSYNDTQKGHSPCGPGTLHLLLCNDTALAITPVRPFAEYESI